MIAFPVDQEIGPHMIHAGPVTVDRQRLYAGPKKEERIDCTQVHTLTGAFHNHRIDASVGTLFLEFVLIVVMDRYVFVECEASHD
jgi:hypothetical protein